MSKMSQLHAELTQQASELGFMSIEEAEANGYEVDYEKGKLVRRSLGYSETVEYLAKEQQKAHEAWLKEKDRMLSILKDVQSDIAEWLDNKDHPDIKGLGEVITFMEDYCHD